MSNKYNKKANATELEEIAVDEIIEEETAAEPVEEEKEVELGTPVRIGKVSCPRLNVRVRPSADSDVLSVLSAGATATIIGESGDFYEIDNIGLHGFCMKQFIEVQ